MRDGHAEKLRVSGVLHRLPCCSGQRRDRLLRRLADQPDEENELDPDEDLRKLQPRAGGYELHAELRLGLFDAI